MSKFSIEKRKKNEVSYIRLNRSKSNADALLHLMRFKDGEFHIVYLPEIKMSSYGETEQEAIDMLMDTLTIYLSNLIGLAKKEMEGELARYGFFVGSMIHKNFEYKGPYVDVKGVLKEFNLPEDTTVEESELISNG
jgi:predicted RNase H-like HicB family nuclease